MLTTSYKWIIWYLLSIQTIVYSFAYRIATRMDRQMKLTHSIKNLLSLIQQYKEIVVPTVSKENHSSSPEIMNLYMEHDPKVNALVQYEKEKEKAKAKERGKNRMNWFRNTAIFHKIEDIYEKITKMSKTS